MFFKIGNANENHIMFDKLMSCLLLNLFECVTSFHRLFVSSSIQFFVSPLLHFLIYVSIHSSSTLVNLNFESFQNNVSI